MIHTPHIDKMASEGIRFTDCYSGDTVCAPARSTLMTGYHIGHTRVRGNDGKTPLHPEYVTVAEVLKKAGYVTGGFGKWDLGNEVSRGAAEKQGFNTFFGYYNQNLRQLLHVAFKVAARNNDFIPALQTHRKIIEDNVTKNLLKRHIEPIFHNTKITA